MDEAGIFRCAKYPFLMTLSVLARKVPLVLIEGYPNRRGPLNMKPDQRGEGEMKTQHPFIVGLMVAIALVALISPAWATPISSFNSTLTDPNDDISGFTGPYGEMTIVLTTATTATVTFTSDTAGGNTYLFGDGTSAGVNVNASSFTITGISGSNGGTGFTPGPYTAVNPPGTSNVSEFGLFNGVIDSDDGYTHASDRISFTLTNTGGTWASASNVLVANAEGYDAVAHIFVCAGTGTDCNASNAALATGFAGENGGVVVPVPEPSALLLLGIGLGGVAALNWRRQPRP
jgi:PEP-CTERM motif